MMLLAPLVDLSNHLSLIRFEIPMIKSNFSNSLCVFLLFDDSVVFFSLFALVVLMWERLLIIVV